jgi:hypothetical protein
MKTKKPNPDSFGNYGFGSLAELREHIAEIVSRVTKGETFCVHSLRLPPGEPVSYAIFNAQRWSETQGDHRVRMENNGLPLNWYRTLAKAVY